MSARSAAESKINDVFNNLSYEPVMDSDSSIKSWVGSHNGCFQPFIDGEYLSVSKAIQFSARNPANGAELAKLVQCDETIVEAAVKSARNAFENWNNLGHKARGRIIYNIARNVQKHLQIVVLVEALNSGRTTREVKDLDVAQIVKLLYYYAGSCGLSDTNQLNSNEALGVVAIAGYWDSALLSLVSKLGAALAAGNTCVIVPHKLATLSAFMLADICKQSGVPNGVINVVMSESDQIYKHLAAHPLIDCVAYDGVVNVAQDLIIKNSAHLPNKRCLFTLNGKSSLVIYDTADFDSAIECVIDGCFYSNGQHRFSINKVLVQENIYDDILERLEKRFEKLRCGSNLDKCNDYGPFINEAECNSFRTAVTDSQYIHLKQYPNAIQDKAQKNVQAPTIITNVQINTDFYQNEVNGPYIIVLPFRTVKESIDILNTSKYGTAVSLWSQNISLVMEVANNVQAGTVWINGCFIERGIETRKFSGNYHLTGIQSLLNFMKPKWQTRLSNENNSTIEQVEKELKTFGALSPNSTVPLSETLNTLKTYKLYVGGKQVRPDTQGSRSVYLGHDEKNKKVACLVADASRKDVRNAVEAAVSALNDWRKRTNHNKSQILHFFGENLAVRREEFVQKLQVFTEKSKTLCESEFDLCLDQIFYYASICDKSIGRVNDTVESSQLLELNESVGCIGIICGATKYPLLSFIVHTIAAIANGNAVIVVPDEVSPVPALDLYEVMETSDLPGVINILTGNKQHLAKYLCEHQQVQSIWYMSDSTNEQSKLNQNDLSAIRFIKYTSNFSLKHTWFINSNDLFNTDDVEATLDQYSNELSLHSTQYKYIHIPFGVIFAN